MYVEVCLLWGVRRDAQLSQPLPLPWRQALLGLLIYIMEESVTFNVSLEKQGDEVRRKFMVEELQCLPQHFPGKRHLAHVETDLQGKEEKR